MPARLVTVNKIQNKFRQLILTHCDISDSKKTQNDNFNLTTKF